MMWEKFEKLNDVCFSVQDDNSEEWDNCPKDPEDQYEAMRKAWQLPGGKVAVISNASTNPCLECVIDKADFWEVKYVLVDADKTDEQVRAYDTEPEALHNANYFWSHHTTKEQKEATEFYVCTAYWDDELQNKVDVIDIIKDFKGVRDITIKEYPANIQVFIEGDCYDISTDGWSENYDFENMDAVIDKLGDYVELTDAEIKYIEDKLDPYVKSHSL